MHKHEPNPRRESNRAILAHVKEVMDEPRMSESAREQEQEGQAEHGSWTSFNAQMDVPGGEE
jgi:hypothetical protein